jgi:hypothetical protein
MASYSVDIRGAIEDGEPVLFWVNANDPYIVASESTAQSGNVAIVRALKANRVGSPMVVKFIVAKAANIIAWQALVDDDPFETTELQEDFETDYTVIFRQKSPIEFSNMVLKDGNYDIRQSIFDSEDDDYKPGFDFWSGTLNLIVAT